MCPGLGCCFSLLPAGSEQASPLGTVRASRGSYDPLSVHSRAWAGADAEEERIPFGSHFRGPEQPARGHPCTAMLQAAAKSSRQRRRGVGTARVLRAGPACTVTPWKVCACAWPTFARAEAVRENEVSEPRGPCGGASFVQGAARANTAPFAMSIFVLMTLVAERRAFRSGSRRFDDPTWDCSFPLPRSRLSLPGSTRASARNAGERSLRPERRSTRARLAEAAIDHREGPSFNEGRSLSCGDTTDRCRG